ncbi:MAG TPA: helix-turn-helix domain-containing protein [Bacteroides sp.]|nr:helix-turn-helix domain-containing protein [Bacteroides sp.]
MKTITIHIKNMVSQCCVILIGERLEKAGIKVEEISLGRATVSFDEERIGRDDIRKVLKELGTDLVEDREKQLVEKIKLAVTELIHHMNNVDSVVRKSDYLVEKLGLTYAYLSRIFSSHEDITLERYIILNKIERIKELIDQDEFTLSEIAYMMDYSSVQYLSTQFRNITGMTVSEYRESDRSFRRPIDQLT